MKKILACAWVLSLGAGSCRKLLVEDNKDQMPLSQLTIKGNKTELSISKGQTPSIILVNGFASPFTTWEKVYQQLPENASVFAYNRAGVGASANVAGSRDALTIAREMKTILEYCSVQPPYVLVAHSMGGIYARIFYHLYPNLVKGIVLVDGTHERQLDSLLSQLPPGDREMAWKEMEAINDSVVATLPSGSLKEEFKANFLTNYEQIKSFPPITGIPVYVITSTKETPETPGFVVNIQKALHQEWAAQAGSKGKFVETSKSGHYIQLEEPLLVKQGIQWVLNK